MPVAKKAKTVAASSNDLILELFPPELLVRVYSFVGTVQELGRSARVSQRWATAVYRDNSLWHEVACRTYGRNVVDATAHLYRGDWKAMIQDDNQKGAHPTLLFHDTKPCLYRNNGTHNDFYACFVHSLVWDRANGQIRLYVDARGEPDLRHPQTSLLQYQHNNQRTTPRSARRCTEWKSDVDINGHKKGCLVFTARDFCDPRVTDIRFSYAKLSGHQGNRLFIIDDYEWVSLLSGPLSIKSFDGHYTLTGESPFDSDTPESEKQRWLSIVPTTILERRAGHAGLGGVWSAQWWAS